MGSSTKVAYITIEATDLLRICFEELKAQPNYESSSELMLRGTLPKSILERIEKSTTLLDPKGLGTRFTAQRRIYIDSWSELVALGSLVRFYESAQESPTAFIACVGIETSYKESGLREKFLGDGAIASRKLNSRQVIQCCLAQNIKGKSAANSLQEEIIIRLKDKLAKAPNEPTQILAVTVMSETQSHTDLNFTEIAKQITEQHKSQTTYEKIFCIIPGFSIQGTPQIAVVPLWLWLPGNPRIIALINIDTDGKLGEGSHDDVEFILPPSP